MHYVKAKGILSAYNGMNIYRGCQHGCIYCDSRSTCYQISHPFEDIEVKQNAGELLDRVLRSRRKPCMIGTGSMSDPYIPLESELGMTRRALEIIYHYGCGVSLLTKSDRVLRDLDILCAINERTKAVVQMTITTLDDTLCSLIEPGASVTSHRLRALKRFNEAGIPTVVWLCPVLPYINDTMANISGIVDACASVGVKGIIQFGMGLTLRDGNRSYYYNALDKHFPGLKEKYIRKYGNHYELPSPREKELLKCFHERCDYRGILHNNDTIFRYLSELEDKTPQMSLWEETE